MYKILCCSKSQNILFNMCDLFGISPKKLMKIIMALKSINSNGTTLILYCSVPNFFYTVLTTSKHKQESHKKQVI